MVRRSIEGTYEEEYPGFCGWDNICNTVEGITWEESQSLFVGYFKTGGRAMELTALRRDQVDLNFSRLNMMINGMKVEKHRKKEYLVDTKGRPVYSDSGKRMFRMLPTKAFRSFPIRKDDPLAEIFIDHITKFSGDELLYPYTYSQIYYRICLVDTVLPDGYSKNGWWTYKGPWWPHRIRAEKACQLRKDLHYDQKDLMDWFGWKTSKMPDLYAKMVPLDLVVETEVKWRGEI